MTVHFTFGATFRRDRELNRSVGCVFFFFFCNRTFPCFDYVSRFRLQPIREIEMRLLIIFQLAFKLYVPKLIGRATHIWYCAE